MARLSNTLARAFAPALMALLVGPVAAPAADLPAYHIPVPVLRTLPNGLRVAVFADRRLPIVQVQLLIPAGAAQEAAETPGVANLVAQLLRAGSSSRTAEAFAADLDRLGGNFTATATRDYSTVSGAFLAADLDAGLELVADAVVNPIFAPEEVDRFRTRSAGLLLQMRRDPAVMADDQLWALSFEGHPYGRHPWGTVESLSRLDHESVRAYHRDFYRPDRAVLAIAGDLDPERAFAIAADRFGSWAGRAATPARVPLPPPPAALRIRIVDLPGQDRSEVRMGLVCPPRTDPDALALELANYLLTGSGPSSRLVQSLRAEGRLDSDVRGSYAALKDAGLLSLAAVARNDSVADLVARVRDELARMATQPASEADVVAARRHLQDTYPLQFQTLGALIAQWLGADSQDLTSTWLDHYAESVAAVTSEQVAGASRRWLNPAHLEVVVAGPAAELKGPLEALGPVEVVGASAAPSVAAPATSTPATAEQRRRGRELLRQALAAHGGLERLRRVKDSSVSGEMVLRLRGNDTQIQMQQLRKDPFRMRHTTRLGSMENGQILNGTRGWIYTSGTDSPQVIDADSVGIAAMRVAFRSDIVHTLLAAADPSAEVAWRGPGKADGRDADLIEVTSPAPPGGGPAEQRLLSLDAKDHRLIAEDPGDAKARSGPAAVRRLYRDYREVNGVLWPFYEERLRGGGRTMTVLLRSVTLDGGVADTLFEKPSSAVPDRPLR